MIENPSLRKIINNYLGDEEELSNSLLENISSIIIEENIDFFELVKLSNLKEIKMYDLEVSEVDLDALSKLEKLEKIFFIRCDIGSLKVLDGMNLDTLFISGSQVKDLEYINNMSIDNLFLEDLGTIDLNDISIIRNVISLSLNNTKVLNEDKMIYLDKIVNLSLDNTGIKNLDTLVENDTLKVLVIDEDIAKENAIVLKALKDKGVSIVDKMNQSMESYYE